MATHHMVFELDVDAGPDAVMAALTTADGIRSWWTSEVELDGASLRPSFPSAPRPFDLAVSQPDERRLVWSAGEFPPPWRGTRCVWELAGGPGGGTTVGFSHRDWDESNPMIGRVTLEWAHVLDHLSRYVATGVPDPRTPAGGYEEG